MGCVSEMNRKGFFIVIIIVLSVFSLVGCNTNTSTTDIENLTSHIEELKEENTKLKEQIANNSKSIPSSSYENNTSISSQEKSTSSTKSKTVTFANKFGTSTTICAHSGCNNYIAPSGDTNCCITHSNRCLECNTYIDEDAAWCMSCLEKALKK